MERKNYTIFATGLAIGAISALIFNYFSIQLITFSFNIVIDAEQPILQHT
jgi:hypothetical protein